MVLSVITNVPVPVVYMGLDLWIWIGENPFLAPHYGLLPHPNPCVSPHINNRYINS
jgi:hypothetical protein